MLKENFTSKPPDPRNLPTNSMSGPPLELTSDFPNLPGCGTRKVEEIERKMEIRELRVEL